MSRGDLVRLSHSSRVTQRQLTRSVSQWPLIVSMDKVFLTFLSNLFLPPSQEKSVSWFSERISCVALSASCLFTLMVATAVGPGSILFAPCIQVDLYINEVCPDLLLLQGELSQLSQSFLIGKVLQSLWFLALCWSLVCPGCFCAKEPWPSRQTSWHLQYMSLHTGRTWATVSQGFMKSCFKYNSS